jgi:hypothetical protein
VAFGVDSFQATLTTYQMQVAVKVAQARMTRLLSKAKSDPKRLEAADQLLQDGDLKTACLIYRRLALSKPRRDASETARRRLENIQDEARRQRVLVDLELDEAIEGSDVVTMVHDVFAKYRQLVRKYGCVPVVGDQIRRHVSRQRRSPVFANILNEAESQRLWELGKQYEREQLLCCAYQVYASAAKLVPSQTAQRAKVRIAELERLPGITTAAVECRNLQRCHEMFQIAETVSETDPKQASQRYQWIIEHSPKDSLVFKEALARLKT